MGFGRHVVRRWCYAIEVGCDRMGGKRFGGVAEEA